MIRRNMVGRERFENDTFPHLDALWRTALWLTMRSNLADDLILKTMFQAYHEWNYNNNVVSNKILLYRILSREFFYIRKDRHSSHKPGQYLSENVKNVISSNGASQKNRMVTFQKSQLSQLTTISDVCVKGTITRLRPISRFIVLLKYRESLSHSEIAYITDLSKSSVKVILNRLRRLIPGYILETADYWKETSYNQLSVDSSIVTMRISL